ncbi:MAG: hypothetical protein ACX932_05930 [Gammaproteobacteria bacterium]
MSVAMALILLCNEVMLCDVWRQTGGHSYEKNGTLTAVYERFFANRKILLDEGLQRENVTDDNEKNSSNNRYKLCYAS